MLRIITDSASDIVKGEAKENNIDLVYLSVNFSDGPFVEDSREDFDRFYHRLETTKDFPKTSQPNVGELIDLFTEIKEAGDEAIYITLSSGLSATYSTAVKALEIVQYDKIYIIDSLTGSAAQALLVYIAVQMREDGASTKEIVEKIEELRDYSHLFVNIDSLEYLKRGGRIPSSIAFIGNALSIKPIVTVNREGSLGAIKKTRGRKSSMKEVINLVHGVEVNTDYPIYILYTSDRSLAEDFKDQFVEASDVDENNLILRPIGTVIGTHVGTNSIGVVFIAKKPKPEIF